MAKRIRRGDNVVVLAGKDQGATGKVVRVDDRKSQVYVEGLGMQYKHVRRSQQNPKGGRVHREGPIHVSNVAIVASEGETGQRFRVELKGSGESAKRVRVGVKDGTVLD